MIRHFKSHKGTFICNICNMGFPTPGIFNMHVMVKHANTPPEEGPFNPSLPETLPFDPSFDISNDPHEYPPDMEDEISDDPDGENLTLEDYERYVEKL